MSYQIFKSEVSKDVLFNFLDNICIKNEKNYILNSMAFKKGVFNEGNQNNISFINLSKNHL
jgi:hypothetical protein